MSVTIVGLLYPGYSAEDDYPTFAQRHADVLHLPLVHTSVGEDAHRVDALLDLGGPQRLAEGARSLLADRSLDALMWACTSGSFVFGWDGARRQVDALADLTSLPVSSTSIAFVEGCRALGLERVALAASYPDDVAARFREFLGHGGIGVADATSHDIVTAAEVGRLSRDQVMTLVSSVDTDEAEAVLIPDTAMHSLAWLDDLEAAAGMPVLTANQVTVWEGLRIAGGQPSLAGAGTLFAHAGQTHV